MKLILLISSLLLTQQGFASFKVESKNENCVITTRDGKTESAVIHRELWHQNNGGHRQVEYRSFIPSDSLIKIMAIDYGRRLYDPIGIGRTEGSIILPDNTQSLKQIEGTISQVSSGTYLGEVNSRLDVTTKNTVSIYPRATDTVSIEIVIEDIGFSGDPNQFKEAYKRNYNLDLAPSTFNLRKISYRGTCSSR